MNTNDNNICVNCGLCCDGTLFHFATINEDEIIDPSFAFRISQSEDGKKNFRLGCCYLKNKVCTIYDKRPYSICSTFQCKQLKSFLSKEVSYDEAMNNINNTIMVKESIEKSFSIDFPDLKADSLNEKINTFEKYYLALPEPVAFRKKYSHLLLDIGKFRLMTNKYFYKEHAT